MYCDLNKSRTIKKEINVLANWTIGLTSLALNFFIKREMEAAKKTSRHTPYIADTILFIVHVPSYASGPFLGIYSHTVFVFNSIAPDIDLSPRSSFFCFYLRFHTCTTLARPIDRWLYIAALCQRTHRMRSFGTGVSGTHTAFTRYYKQLAYSRMHLKPLRFMPSLYRSIPPLLVNIMLYAKCIKTSRAFAIRSGNI